MPTFPLPPVYPITDKALARRSTHLSILKELVRGGAGFVQLRDKSTPTHELVRDMAECADFAAKKGVALIVNDRCDLALCCGAAGVHLGQDDLPPAAARTIMGGKSIIGLSTHSADQVQAARSLPIQYIGFGPVYGTSTKESAHRQTGLAGLQAACRNSNHPVVAIGGIGLDQVHAVLDAGASSAAVISALMKATDLAREMELFLERARGR